MCEALMELFAEELNERENQGKNKGIELAKKVFNLANEHLSAVEIAEKCGITEERVQQIIE